jgi:hypothetical protein
MDNPLIGTFLFGVVFVGILLMLVGAVGKDRDMLGGGALAGLFGRQRDQDEVDRYHPPERHRGRLMLVGAGLVVAAVAAAVTISALGG